MERLTDQFLLEGRELIQSALDGLSTLARAPDRADIIDAVFRAVHTLKGSTGLFDLQALGDMLHAAEDLLGALRTKALASNDEIVETLVLCIDQAARWLDRFEADGTLPPDAADVGAGIRATIGRWLGTPDAPPARRQSGGDRAWAAALIDGLDPRPEGTLVAFRYVPREDCFFTGDDPIAIVKAVPALCALTIGLREPPGALDKFEPFRCTLILEAVSTAPHSEVQAALRLVADQVDIIDVEPPRARVPADAEVVRDTASRTLRVDVEHVDALARIADEIVVANNGLAHLAAEARRGMGGDALVQSLAASQLELDRLAGSLHRAVTRVRMVPLSSLFQRFPRLMREIGAKLGKDVALTIEGETIEVDKSLVDGLFEPILHLLRNAADHGIERADDRRLAGKPPRGSIAIAARRSADQVVIDIIDDGAGIDPARIRAAVLARALLTEEALAGLTEQETVDLIFTPGFSTSTAVTDLSGRGVGMDAVQTAILRAGGQIQLLSVPGKGTTARLVLPAAVVLTNVIVVACAGETYGIPMDMVIETVRIAAGRIVPIRNGRAFVLRDMVIPVIELRTLLGMPAGGAAADLRLLVLRTGNGLIAIAIDEFVDRLSLLLRPMSGLLSGLPGIAGSAVLGDGKVLMILDLPGLLT